MKNFKRKTAGMLLVIMMAGSVWGQTTYTSTTSGNWSTMTWSPSGTPGSNDNVVIADGHTVTINQEVTIVSLTVQGTNASNYGTLTIQTGAQLSTTGNTTIYGKLYIEDGIFNEGNSSGDILKIDGTKLGSSCLLSISGGTLNTSRYFALSNSSSFEMSGGIMNVNSSGGTSSTDIFYFPSGTTFTMSSGTINILNGNLGSGAAIKFNPTTSNVTGGTINFTNLMGYNTTTLISSNTLYDINCNVGSENTFLIQNMSSSMGFECHNFTVTSGIAQIDPGFGITVNDNITTNGALVLASDATSTGSLIVNGAVTGDITTERYIAAASDWINANDGWHLLSSPVASQAISGDWTPDGSSSNDYDFYKWDESQQLYLNQKIGDNNINTFNPGVGYFVAYQAVTTPEFTGVPNTSSQTKTLTLSGVPAADNSYGYNLLGNPFQSAIDWSHASWDKTDVNGVAKIWNNGAFIDIDDDPSIIPAMNGFFVSTSSNNNSFTIPVEARVHNSQNWYKSVSNNTIKLIAKDVEGHLQQESRIRFNVEATATFDQAFDGPFMTGYAPLFYSTDETHLYSTNTLPELNDELEIPFGFVKNASSSFEIELAKSIDDVVVYLTDFKSGVQHNLTESGKYSFTATEGDNPDRFLLHFGIVGIEDNTSNLNQINAYAYQNQLYVQSNLNEARVSLFDIQGHQLLSREIDGAGSSRIPLDLPSGIYIVRLQSNNQVKNVKVFIN